MVQTGWRGIDPKVSRSRTKGARFRFDRNRMSSCSHGKDTVADSGICQAGIGIIAARATSGGNGSAPDRSSGIENFKLIAAEKCIRHR